LPIVAHATFISTSKTYFGGSQCHLSSLGFQQRRQFFSSPLGSSPSSDNSNKDGGGDGLDSMRKLLEASWNVETMGAVPSSPETAAEGAANSMMTAVEQGKRLLFVDLLLPSYDITQGYNMYDDVSAVEFCIELIKYLDQKAVILVRDDKSKNSLSRVLEVKDRNAQEKQSQLDSERQKLMEDTSIDDDENDDDDVDDADTEDSKISGSDDDDSETKSKDTDAPSDGMDIFRQKLMASWESSTEEQGAIGGKSPPTEQQKPKAPRPIDPTTGNARIYRLASILGDDRRISSGPEMPDDVVNALRNNGLPEDDEEAIVILSAVTTEEMVGIRALVSKYSSSKTIVFVNCKFPSVPPELRSAETVYSLLPLVARSVVSDTNILAGSKKKATEDEKPPTKIVSMRRYPDDWELHVDTNGKGFELIDTMKAAAAGKEGPGMDWIALSVKRHMQREFGRGKFND